MKIVPSAVICGVTSSLSTASIKVIEIVLLIVVWIGIFVPCFTTAFSLFCVTTRGFERSLPTPRDSAAVMKKSTAKFGERWPKKRPLVGTPAPRLTARGKFVIAGDVGGCSGGGTGGAGGGQFFLGFTPLVGGGGAPRGATGRPGVGAGP